MDLSSDASATQRPRKIGKITQLSQNDNQHVDHEPIYEDLRSKNSKDKPWFGDLKRIKTYDEADERREKRNTR